MRWGSQFLYSSSFLSREFPEDSDNCMVPTFYENGPPIETQLMVAHESGVLMDVLILQVVQVSILLMEILIINTTDRHETLKAD